MNKTFLIFLLLLGLGSAQAAPIEDEPLPFDTKMPPRVVMQQSGVAEPVAAVVKPTSNCKTIVKKVHGRKVRKEVCSKAVVAKPSGKSRKSTVAVKSKKSGHKTAVVKSTSKKHKRR